MSSILREAFNDDYVSQVDLNGRLDLLYKFRQKVIKQRNMDELLIINGFLDIINGQIKEAEEYFESNFFNSEDIIVKLAKVMIHNTKAEKVYVPSEYEDAIKKLDDAIKKLEGDINHPGSDFLFIKLTLCHGYYLMAEKQQVERSRLYQKAFSIVDSVIKEHENDEDREKLVRFYNEKGNILLQLADFDESMQPLIYDENGKPKIFDEHNKQLNEFRKLNMNDCFDAAEDCYNKANEINDKFAYVYNGLGNLYREKGKFAKAIEYYKIAIKLDKSFFYPLNYLGDCYRLIEKYDDARKSFEEALKIKPNHVFSLYGLGKVYYELGNRTENGTENFKIALDYFNEAKKADKSFPYTWFDLGRTKTKLESDNIHKLDLDYMLNAMEMIAEQDNELCLESNTLVKEKANKYKVELEKMITNHRKETINYYDEIINYLSMANKLFQKKYTCEITKRRHWESTINYCIKDFNKKLEDYEKLIKIGLNIINNNSTVNPHEKVLFFSILTGIEEQAVKNDVQFKSTFLSNKVTNQESDNTEEKHTLHILRRWNSYTPIIADNSKGGGYFIECTGNGIVIDPGHNFIDNFKQANFKFADVNTILISHSHDDHTADLESIINLLYRYNKQLKSYTIPRRIAKEKGVATKTVEDILKNKEDHAYLEYKALINKIYLKELKKINFYISEGVFIKYAGIFKYDDNCQIDTLPDYVEDGEVKNVLLDINSYKEDKKKKRDKDDEEIEPSYYVTIIHEHDNIPPEKKNIHVIKAHHKDLFNDNSSLGFVFEFDRTALIYTGDTGWKGLDATYEEVKTKLRGKEIILLSHLGGFKEHEINILGSDEKSKKDYYYKNHLGRLGLVEINRILRPRVCIISEFGEEFKYNRLGIAKLFNESFKTLESLTTFIPADIGLSIDLDNALVEAFVEIDSNDEKIKCSVVEAENINIGENKKGNSLFYFSKINLKENDCLQALVQDYKICSH